MAKPTSLASEITFVCPPLSLEASRISGTRGILVVCIIFNPIQKPMNVLFYAKTCHLWRREHASFCTEWNVDRMAEERSCFSRPQKDSLDCHRRLPTLVCGWFQVRLAFEPLFLEYGVDIALFVHKHFYERMTPIANGTSDPKGLHNPSVPWYLVNGAAGHYEILVNCGHLVRELYSQGNRHCVRVGPLYCS